MSGIAISTLKELELLTKTNDVPSFTGIPQEEIKAKLAKYREIRLQKLPDELKALRVTRNEYALLLNSYSSNSSANNVLPINLLTHRIFIDDILFKFACPEDEISKTMKEFHGGNPTDDIDIASLGNKLLYYSYLAPLMENSFMCAIPLSFLMEKKEKGMPVYFDMEGFKNDLPKNIYEFIHKQAIIRPLINEGGTFIIEEKTIKEPCRHIAIEFKNDFCNQGVTFYILHEQKFISFDEDKGTALTTMNLPDTPPSKEQFDAWVHQSINRTMISRLKQIGNEFSLSEYLRSNYMTESPFESKLLSLDSVPATEDPIKTAELSLMNAVQPEIPIGEPADVARFKEKNVKELMDFQEALKSCSYELCQITDPARINLKAKELFETRIKLPTEELRKSLNRFWRNCKTQGLITAGTIVLAIGSGTQLPLLLAIGGGLLTFTQAKKKIDKYKDLKSHPMYTLLKLGTLKKK